MHNVGKMFIAIVGLASILMLVYAQTALRQAVIKTANSYEVTNVTELSTFNANICGKSLYVIEEVANSTYAKLSINYFEYSLHVGSKQSLATLPQNCYVELLNVSNTSVPNTTSFLFSEIASNTTINVSSQSAITSVTTATANTVQPTINVTTVAASANSMQTSDNPFEHFWSAITSFFSKLLGSG